MMVMKYIRWVEARVFTLPDRRVSPPDETKDDEADATTKALPLIQNSFLPIAAAFISASVPESSSQSVETTEHDPQCDGPLISRPRPIAPNGTEKSFFSRGTIPTENTTLPTRIHSKYRPSYAHAKEDAARKLAKRKLSGREHLLSIITEMYPNIISSINISHATHRKHGSTDSTGTPTSIKFKSDQTSIGSAAGSLASSPNFSSTIPTYANLPTPPLSPLKSAENKTISFDSLAKDDSDVDDQEFSQIRNFLVNFLNIKGNQLPKQLQERIMECFSIPPIEVISVKTATVTKDENEMHERSIKMLVRALIYQNPDKWPEANESHAELEKPAETKPLPQTPQPAPPTTQDYLAPTSNLNSKIARAHSSESNLAKYRPKFSNSELPSLLRIPNSVLTARRMPSLNLKKNFRDVFSR